MKLSSGYIACLSANERGIISEKEKIGKETIKKLTVCEL